MYWEFVAFQDTQNLSPFSCETSFLPSPGSGPPKSQGAGEPRSHAARGAGCRTLSQSLGSATGTAQLLRDSGPASLSS